MQKHAENKDYSSWKNIQKCYSIIHHPYFVLRKPYIVLLIDLSHETLIVTCQFVARNNMKYSYKK